MKNYTTPDFGWPHYKHEGNMISVFTASGIMSPILRKAREVYPGHMVRFVEWKELDRLHGVSTDTRSKPKGFGKSNGR